MTKPITTPSLMVLILAISGCVLVASGQNPSADGGGPQEARQRLTQLLVDARTASGDQWLVTRKQGLTKMQARMEQQNAASSQAIAAAIAEVGKILDEARGLADDAFNMQRDQLVSKLMRSVASGMGRGSQTRGPGIGGKQQPVPASHLADGSSQVTASGSVSPIQWIDVHNHLMGRPQEMAASVTAALAVMDQCGISKMIIMPTPCDGIHMKADCENFSSATGPHVKRFAFLGGGSALNGMLQQAGKQIADNDILRQKFERQANEILKQGAIGFGEIAIHHLSLHSEEHPYESVSGDHPLLLLLADIAARNDVPIDIHFDVVTNDIPIPDSLASRNNPAVLHANLEAFERLLDHNPIARICWAHAGSDNTGHWTTDLSRRLLQRHPNLYMSLRMGPGHAPENFPLTRDRQIRPEWLQLLKDFPNRFVIGSDQFLASQSFHGSDLADMLVKKVPMTRELTPIFLKAIPSELAQKIAWENAMALYKLKN